MLVGFVCIFIFLVVVALDYCTIDLVPDKEEIPRFAFQIVSLKEGETFLFAAQSSKELADWILNLRDIKAKRGSFCLNESPLSFAKVEEQASRRKEAMQMLEDYVSDKVDKSKFVHGVKFKAIAKEPDAAHMSKVGGVVLGASSEKLMHLVFDSTKTDEKFIRTFFVAFRTFAKPRDLFEYVKEKFKHGSADTAHRIGIILEQWIVFHLYDFLDDLELCKVLLEFVDFYASVDIKSTNANRNRDKVNLKAVLAKRLAESPGKSKEGVALNSLPLPILPQIFRSSAFDLLDLAPLEIARQICILQHDLLCKIEPHELLGESWSGSEGANKAPNVNAFIANFNQLCGWITSLIVSCRPPIPRIAMIHRFIDIAKCCLELQNFNAVMAIVGALQASPVHRLKEDWETVPKDSLEQFGELKALFVTSGNFKTYRNVVSTCEGPAIPYLGLMLQDLTFLEQNKNKKVINGISMCNLEKAEKIASVLADLNRFQALPYAFRYVFFVFFLTCS